MNLPSIRRVNIRAAETHIAVHDLLSIFQAPLQHEIRIVGFRRPGHVRLDPWSHGEHEDNGTSWATSHFEPSGQDRPQPCVAISEASHHTCGSRARTPAYVKAERNLRGVPRLDRKAERLSAWVSQLR